MADDVGSLLLRAGLVDPDQLTRARAAVQTGGGTVPAELVRSGHLGDEALTAFYRSRLLIPRVNPSELTRLTSRLLEKVPADMAAEFRSIPVALDADGNLTLIMSDPSDTKAAEEISFFTGSYVMRAVATQAQIAWCLAHYYKQETELYRELVAEGLWPDAESDVDMEVAESDPSLQTAPMKTRPRPVNLKRQKTAKSGQVEDGEKEESTGPLKTRTPKRPANQHPSPPELFARAGEIESVPKREPKMDSAPGIQVFLDEAVPAVVQAVQRGTDTAPILLSSIKARMDMAASGPIILDAKNRKRRVSRQTSLGLGAIGSDSPIQRALAEHAEAEPLTISAGLPEDSGTIETAALARAIQAGEYVAAVDPENSRPTVRDIKAPTAEEIESATSEAAAQESSRDSKAPTDDDVLGPTDEDIQAPTDEDVDKVVKVSTAADDAERDAQFLARTVDLVGGDWGLPGTTIPPNFLGAQPQAYEDVSDSIPIAVDDNDGVTTQINTNDPSIPVAIPSSGDATVRSDAPRAVTQSNLTESASHLLVALRAIDASDDKRGVLEPILTFLDLAFERTGFLALRQDDLTTWLLHGCTDDARGSISIDEDSALRDVVRMRLPYNGPIEDAITKRFARDLDMPDALDVLGLPIAIRDRVVGVLFGLGSYDSIFEEHLMVLSQAAGEAFERLLRARK